MTTRRRNIRSSSWLRRSDVCARRIYSSLSRSGSHISAPGIPRSGEGAEEKRTLLYWAAARILRTSSSRRTGV